MEKFMKKIMGALAGIVVFTAVLEGITRYRIRKFLSRD